MDFMERLGYVRKDRYEAVVRETETLRVTVARLEAKVSALQEDRRRIEERAMHMKKAVEFIEVADTPKETALGLIKKGIEFLLKVLQEAGE